MKSIIPFYLFILFSLTISYNTITEYSKIFGVEKLLISTDNFNDDSKTEDSENTNEESCKDFFYSAENNLVFKNSNSNLLRTNQSNSIIFFQSHSYIEEIYSPPDFS